ncbi:hypothetical protein C7W88_17885 (plasmid) [Novosphingobium sp. THN1]|uniref:hypothetical protein n=1 Tax=Novosphingobium sp. THN1 TaxID=1016987 RepID=UPI000E5033E3|nr:hypothetical protein [Novosphingobium sp. THN1]AXU20885.1 hypothetical protein C7W88_17885 [Novosphingobium sp. THN1]
MNVDDHPHEAKQLRFALDLYEDESIIGAIARAADQHVLFRLQAVLDAAEVKTFRPATLQHAAPSELARIAHVIRCDPAELVGRAGRGITDAVGFRKIAVEFGENHIISGRMLDYNTRRIAPKALLQAEYHRLDWFNVLLQYCPQTLELVVNTCPSCDNTLGWKAAAGIGSCEFCGVRVPPSSEPALPGELAENYRRFAELVSLHKPTASRARAQLASPDLAKLPTNQLIELVMDIGCLFLDEPPIRVTNLSLNTSNLKAAQVLCCGVEYLADWPDSFQSSFQRALHEHSKDPTRIQKLWRATRKVSDTLASGPLAAITDPAAQGAIAPEGQAGPFSRRYTERDVERVLQMPPEKRLKLHAWPELRVQSLTKRMRHLGAYDGCQIDELAQHFVGLAEIEATSWQIKLPHYAIEALLDAGLLVWEDHPAVRTVRPKVAIRSSSVIDFQARVQTAAGATRPPAGCTTLLSAAKRIGGRRKPWAAIYRALLDGEMRFWLSGSREVGPSHLLVQPEDMLRFDPVSDEVLRPDLPRASVVSKMDACEILNLTPRYFAPVEHDFGITFTQNGNAKTADFEEVLSIARQAVWPTEITKHLDMHAKLLSDILPKFRIPRVGTGWCRKTLIDKGILPTLADDTPGPAKLL